MKARIQQWRGAVTRRLQPRSRTGHTPAMIPVRVALPIWLSIAALTAWVVNLWLRTRPDIIGANPEPLDVTKIVLTIVGGIGAVFVGVYAYRKQGLEEGASKRADDELFLTRYNAATDQLAHTRAAARLAGVYSMVRLADDWPTQRQQCVDVLCAYLRMPAADESQDREVRATIVHLIAEHLRNASGAPGPWSALNFDLSRATLANADFAGAHFTGTRTRFNETVFAGVVTRFMGATFRHRHSFVGAVFDAEETSFEHATFHGDLTPFDEATFGGEQTSFYGAAFDSQQTTFRRVTFDSERTLFGGTVFSGEVMSFTGATFNGKTWLGGIFIGDDHVGQRTSFDGTSLADVSFSASFSRCVVTFDGASRVPPGRVNGLDSLILLDGSSVTRNGRDFRGWDD